MSQVIPGTVSEKNHENLLKIILAEISERKFLDDLLKKPLEEYLKEA